MSVYMVANGRITQTQLDEAVRHLHNDACSSFDGGERNKPSSAGPMTPLDRVLHEAQIVRVIRALEKVGFKVEASA